jgi:hypothetical protein
MSENTLIFEDTSGHLALKGQNACLSGPHYRAICRGIDEVP